MHQFKRNSAALDAGEAIAGRPAHSGAHAQHPMRALIAAVSGYAMDGFDLLILGFMLNLTSGAHQRAGWLVGHLDAGRRRAQRDRLRHSDATISAACAC